MPRPRLALSPPQLTHLTSITPTPPLTPSGAGKGKGKGGRGGKSVSSSAKAGLQFPVARFTRYLRR